jgi:hypothetical protein
MLKIAECYHKITSLNVSLCCHISDISVIRIAECCHDIEILNVARCFYVTDASIMKIADLCHNIKKLDISKCHVKDRSIRRIVEGCVIIKDINIAVRKIGTFYETYFQM